jgi:hypothetical protein
VAPDTVMPPVHPGEILLEEFLTPLTRLVMAVGLPIAVRKGKPGNLRRSRLVTVLPEWSLASWMQNRVSLRACVHVPLPLCFPGATRHSRLPASHPPILHLLSPACHTLGRHDASCAAAELALSFARTTGIEVTWPA